jgi:hypothetical protein
MAPQQTILSINLTSSNYDDRMPVTVIRITVHDDAKTKDLDELQSSRPLANLHQNQPNNGDPSTNSNEIVTLHKIQNHASRLYIECIEKYFH